MGYKNIFRRYELKFLITQEQKKRLQRLMAPYMEADAYGRSVIRNLYFDTPDHRLVRRSLEGPLYKEKLRVRGYGTMTPDSTVFVELKKKYDSIVYKRRVPMLLRDAAVFLYEHRPPTDTQITREIAYCMDFYGDLRPAMYLSYEREAFFGKEDAEFRITFDENIRWREHDLTLCAATDGERLLPDDTVLLEVKTATALPLWLTHFFTQEQIYKTSFSKYGTAYQKTQSILRSQGGISYV